MKKWTYLVAAGMLLGATPVFTGCIDNDEPEGISILRGAKAELLSAKAAVEAAKVAQVQADAALTLAQAKVQEAEAMKVQAQAKKIEAEAKIAEAKAALLNAKTESEKARLQGIIDENKRDQTEWEEKAAQRAAEAEAAIKEAEYKALTAQAKYQAALVELQTSQQKVLANYITKLNTASTNYYDALDDLRVAQRNVNKQTATVEENEASKERLTRGLKKAVSLKESAVKGSQDAQKIAEEELAAAKELKPSELITEREDVIGKALSIKKEIADLTVEASKTIAGFYANGGHFETVKGLWKEYDDATVAPQTIAAVEFDFGDGAGYPSYMQRGKISLPELEYSSVETDNYINELATLDYVLEQFQSWTRDENDNAWTQERVVRYEGKLAELEKEIAAAKKSWQEAVSAYNTNKYNESDMTKISGYDKVVTEITAFNKAADGANKAYAEKARLEDKKKADLQTQTDAKAANKVVKDAADKKAKADQTTAMANIDKTVKAKEDQLDGILEAAKKANAAAKAAWTAAKTDAEKAIAAAAWDKAEKAEQAAQTARNAYSKVVEQTAIKKTFDDAIAASLAAQTKADAAANKAYNDLWNETTGTDTANLAAAVKAIETAEAALTKAKDVYNKRKVYQKILEKYTTVVVLQSS